MNVKDSGPRILRWRLLLEEYDFTVIHKTGKKNVNADCLSRTIYSVDDITEERKKEVTEGNACMSYWRLSRHVQRTYERIKLYTSWPNMFQDIQEYIRSCKTCQMIKQTQITLKAPLQLTVTPLQVSDKIALDLVGPLPLTEMGNKYILTCQDLLSKYLIAIAIPNITIEMVAETFINDIILQ